jgi:cell division protein ZipA
LETSTLRWILIIAGVIVLASIWLFFNPDKKRKPKASRRSKEEAGGRRKGASRARREPTLDTALQGAPQLDDPDFGSALDEGEPVGQGELDIGSEPPDAPPKPERIVSLFLLASDHHIITGAELLQATVNTGMAFGEMNIFHRIPEGTETAIFSMANAAKPGHFERDEWNTFETTGVVLFMTLPGPLPALDAWDAMLATGRRMAEVLHAELLDEDRSPFTRQTEAQVREEMREYDRTHPAQA